MNKTKYYNFQLKNALKRVLSKTTFLLNTIISQWIKEVKFKDMKIYKKCVLLSKVNNYL